MVHIPDEDSESQAQQPAKPARKRANKDGSSGNVRVPASLKPALQAKQNKRTTKKVPGKTRSAAPKRPTGTQILSLDPPKHRTGAQLGKAKTRMDGMGAPSTISSRNRSLMGSIGREKTPQESAPAGSANTGHVRKIGRKQTKKSEAFSMGGASQEEMDTMVIHRKETSRIPKKGGGIQGVSAPLESMTTGPRPANTPPQARGQAASDIDPAARQNLPPLVNVPIVTPQRVRPTDQAPPPPSARGNTLAGVSAEELLGEEGRQLLKNMRQRSVQSEIDSRQAPVLQNLRSQVTPEQQLAPGATDSSRMAFQSAEYTNQALEEQQKNDQLAPQSDFMHGPTRHIERDVLQTPMPVGQSQPTVADAEFERAVDFGESIVTEGAEVDISLDDEAYLETPQSDADDEVEQETGYLLWLQGVVLREEIEDALSECDVREELQDLLAEGGFSDQNTLYRFLARHESPTRIDLEVIPPTYEALAQLSSSTARSYRVVPVSKMGNILLIAASFPFDPQHLLELRRMTRSKIKLFVATEDEIENALHKYYPVREASSESQQASDTSGEELEIGYDPTLSGKDSGLYPSLSDGSDGNAQPASSSVTMQEIDKADESYYEDEPIAGPESSDTLRDVPIWDDADLDESTLDISGDYDSADDSGLELDNETSLDGGPEDHDPFA